MGAEARLAGGLRLRLLEFIPEAQAAWRPAGPGQPGAGQPAVHLAVGRPGGAPADFWLFPGLSGPREVGDLTLSAQAVDQGLSRAAAVVELSGERGSLGEYAVEQGKPLRYRGWQITLRGLDLIDERGPRVTGTAILTVSWDPGIWVVYVGMVLLGVGLPWLLWTRLRRVAELSAGED
jgi:hypothetical protein